MSWNYTVLIPRRISMKFIKYLLAVMLAAGIFVGYFPVRRIIAIWRTPNPQAILVLGGGYERLPYAVEISRIHPDITVWYSGNAANVHFDTFAEAGVPMNNIHIDERARDTVTNFTTLVDDMRRLGIRYVYLVTSDYHMRRASIIATVVLGSRGIGFTPMPVPTSEKQESWARALRDYIRSIVWLISGHTGASLKNTSINT